MRSTVLDFIARMNSKFSPWKRVRFFQFGSGIYSLSVKGVSVVGGGGGGRGGGGGSGATLGSLLGTEPFSTLESGIVVVRVGLLMLMTDLLLLIRDRHW